MSTRIVFAFRSSYQGSDAYDVTHNGRTRRIEHRVAAPKYDAISWNMTAEQFKAEVTEMIGTVSYAGGDPVEPEIVEAFNAMLREDHAGFLSWLEQRPECRLYAAPEMLAAPAAVVTAHWDAEVHRMVRADVDARASCTAPAMGAPSAGLTS